jgi:hypothetical protein
LRGRGCGSPVGLVPEGLEHVRPQLIEVVLERDEAADLGPVDPPGPLGTRADEPGAREHLEVLGDGGTRNRQASREVPDRLRTVTQSFEDLPPGRVGKGFEGVLVARHGR